MSLARTGLAARRLLSAGARGLASQALKVDAKFPPYILNAPATEVTTLGNGVRVASEGGHGETATVGVFIDAGSRYETAATSGTAHFLEHLTFKGTSRMSQYDLEVEFENMGGHLNAYTSREHTVYYAKVFKADVPKAVSILSDMLTAPKLDEAAIERERSVILREAEEVSKQHNEVIFDLLHETAYEDTGLGRTILGPSENILKISKADLQDFIATHYTGPRIVVAGAGAIEHSALVEIADKAFGRIPKAPASGKPVLLEKSPFVGSHLVHRDDDIGLAHIAIAFETGGWTNPHSFPLMVAQTILGNWDRTLGAGANVASPLCRRIAEGNAAHSISAFNTSYKETGLFGVYAVCDPTTVEHCSSAMTFEMVRLCHETTDEEVARAKVQLKTSLLSQLDGSTAICEDIGRQMLCYGRRMTPAEVFARIDAVDASAVRAAANEFVNDREVAVAGIGNVHELPDINWFRRRSYWLRY